MLAVPIPEKKHIDCDFIADRGSATNSARDSARIDANKFDLKCLKSNLKLQFPNKNLQRFLFSIFLLLTSSPVTDLQQIARKMVQE